MGFLSYAGFDTKHPQCYTVFHICDQQCPVAHTVYETWLFWSVSSVCVSAFGWCYVMMSVIKPTRKLDTGDKLALNVGSTLSGKHCICVCTCMHGMCMCTHVRTCVHTHTHDIFINNCVHVRAASQFLKRKLPWKLGILLCVNNAFILELQCMCNNIRHCSKCIYRL
jgi:hypothetical protein